MTLPQYQRQGYGRFLIDFSQFALLLYESFSFFILSYLYSTYLLSTQILRSLTAQWAARVRHLLLSVATARTLFQSTPRSTRSSLSVDRQVFVGRPRRLPLPRGVHDMAWLAGRPDGILMMWPAIRSRLSATMSCNLRCPVRLSSSILVTWSFHIMPKIFPCIAVYAYSTIGLYLMKI